ncbi:MAG: GIY-YIG nuclease family protein [Cyclobacteriaceae bacterium]
MYKVYAIRSLLDGRIYVGFTANLDKRLKKNNAGKTKSTKGYRPWKLIFFQEIETRQLAREREVYLKSGVGKEFLKTLI